MIKSHLSFPASPSNQKIVQATTGSTHKPSRQELLNAFDQALENLQADLDIVYDGGTQEITSDMPVYYNLGNALLGNGSGLLTNALQALMTPASIGSIASECTSIQKNMRALEDLRTHLLQTEDVHTVLNKVGLKTLTQEPPRHIPNVMISDGNPEVSLDLSNFSPEKVHSLMSDTKYSNGYMNRCKKFFNTAISLDTWKNIGCELPHRMGNALQDMARIIRPCEMRQATSDIFNGVADMARFVTSPRQLKTTYENLTQPSYLERLAIARNVSIQDLLNEDDHVKIAEVGDTPLGELKNMHETRMDLRDTAQQRLRNLSGIAAQSGFVGFGLAGVACGLLAGDTGSSSMSAASLWATIRPFAVTGERQHRLYEAAVTTKRELTEMIEINYMPEDLKKCSTKTSGNNHEQAHLEAHHNRTPSPELEAA